MGCLAMYAMMALIKILLLATTAACQAILVTVPCAGMAARVFIQTPVVIMILIVLMALMNLTHIPSVTTAQRRGVCPAQVFLGTVESSVMAVQPVQISGTNYSPFVNLTLTQTNQMDLMLPSAMRKIPHGHMTSTNVKMDLCA